MKQRQHHLIFVAMAVAAVLALVPAARSQARRSPNPDAECLACHAQADLKSASGRSVSVNEARQKAGVHANVRCTSCHSDTADFPHPERVRKVDCSACHAQQAGEVPASVHAALGVESCSSCHGPAHDVRAAATLRPQLCGSCHAGELKDFVSSVHGAAQEKGDPQSPTCLACHGAVHRILAAGDSMSPVAKPNLPATCGSCHSDPGFLARHQIPFAHPVESYQAGVHGRALAAGNQNAASCSDCHTAHAIYDARDPRSTINHWNVPRTCAACHGEIAKAYGESVHGQAVANGAVDAPVCTDCHGDHTILAPNEPRSPVNPSRVSLVTCGRCHGDQRLEARYNLPTDRVPTFADSYHGLAARAGSQSVANCASCHGVHSIFPSSDPRSTVNAANLAHTCGACHAGAGQAFAIGLVHVSRAAGSESAAVKWIRRIYWVLIPLTMAFMFFHHFLDFWRKLRKNRRPAAVAETERMNLNFRIAHWLAVASFPVLVVTGFALRFPEAWWARPMQIWESRFAFRGTMHRIAAVVLLASLAYHLVHLIFVRRDRVFWREMLPRSNDLRDLAAMLRFNLGLSEARPAFGMFSYVEKIEYLAFLWGTAIMAGTGSLLWFNGLALRHFPKWVSDAATSLHFYEAILATCAIAIWHMYSVIFDPDVYPMDTAWLTGKTSAGHLRRARPADQGELFKAEQPRHSEPENAPAAPASPNH